MGYTHYFPQNKAPSTIEWNAYKNAIKIAFDEFHKNESTKHIRIATGNGEILITNAKYLFDENDNLRFNGYNDEAFETFKLYKGIHSSFNFCKTNRNHYDLFVNICLILAHLYLPNCIEITSNGNADDWKNSIDFIIAIQDMFETPINSSNLLTFRN